MGSAFTGLATRPTHSFPIDRDHARGHAGQRRDPALELLRVKGDEDVAEMVVRRGPIEEQAEPTEEIERLDQ
jgi:hypothetical protein